MIRFSKEVQKPNFLCYFLVILFLSVLSTGAWWDFGKQKKEPQKTTIPEPVSEPVSQPVPELVFEAEPPESLNETERITPRAVSAEKQPEEIEKIQDELKQIIDRTQKLQGDVKENRSEIQTILERAQIHERILRTISVPRQAQMANPINADEIIKREKLRLIAEQTQRTQQQLRIIQQTRSIKAAQYHPTIGKTSETS